MKQLTIHQLYLFETQNKLGKRVDFKKGINIITSEKENGNDVGKSIILKSIYHTLGADSIFDDKWKDKSKIYVVKFSVNNEYYYINRSDKLFKIFDDEMNMLFTTINRSELAEYLKNIFNFGIKLPNKDTDEMELAPPVYSYLLNYIDQDRMKGPKFESFESLYQFKMDKNAILFNHFGIYTDEYFKTREELEILKNSEKDLKNELTVINNMLSRMKIYLDDYDAPNDLAILNQQLENKKAEYTVIVNDMKKYKNILLSLRNSRSELKNDILDLKKWSKSKQKDIRTVFNHQCPTCTQDIKDDFTIKLAQYNQLEDFYIMENHLSREILTIERKINQSEKKFQQLVERLEIFEKEMNINNLEVSNVLRHRGYLETQNNMLRELEMVQINLENNKKEMTDKDNTLKKYKDKEKSAHEIYEQLMIDSINRFSLKEISVDKVNKINNNFNSRGSNIPISTIIWYFNLLKVKYELNPDAIRFPLLLDSPNNVETDKEKEAALFNYIFKNVNKKTQLIISSLGFKAKEYKNIEFDKVIDIKVNKYQLLNREEYDENRHLLNRMFEEDYS